MRPDFVARGVVFDEMSAQRAGDHQAAGLFYAAHGHAGVRGFDQHRDAARLELRHERVGDLAGQALLNLQAQREALDQARQLAQAHDLAFGQIGNVRLPHERQHVVFAHRIEGDVFEDHDFVVIFVERRFEMFAGIVAVAAENFGVHARHARGRVEQAVAFRVLADSRENFFDRAFNAFLIHSLLALLTISACRKHPPVFLLYQRRRAGVRL